MRMLVLRSAVRGHHYYKARWHPIENESLNCFYEANNPNDLFAIKVCKIGSDEIVGHLPMEISRITKFLLDRGASVSANLIGTHY